MKYIPINGLKFNISFKLHWFGLNDKSVVEFNFITKDYFEKIMAIYAIIVRTINLIHWLVIFLNIIMHMKYNLLNL